MEIKLLIEDLPVMPRNRSHMLTTSKGRPMNIKTELCRHYERTLEGMLHKYAEVMLRFKREYIPEEHYISATYYIFTPHDLLFTKKGTISAKSTDVDAHKVMTDTIFRVMGIDDKVMRDCRVITPVSYDGAWNQLIIFKLEKICNLKNEYSSILSSIEPEKQDLTWSALL